MSSSDIKSILFVCTGNSCRSPMAEVMAKHLFPSTLQIASAGTHVMPGSVATAGALHAMQALGLNLSAHRSQMLTADLIAEYDLLVCMSVGHKYHIIDMVPEAASSVKILTEFMGLDERGIDDPIGLHDQEYLLCAQQIQQGLELLLISLQKQEDME